MSVTEEATRAGVNSVGIVASSAGVVRQSLDTLKDGLVSASDILKNTAPGIGKGSAAFIEKSGEGAGTLVESFSNLTKVGADAGGRVINDGGVELANSVVKGSAKITEKTLTGLSNLIGTIFRTPGEVKNLLTKKMEQVKQDKEKISNAIEQIISTDRVFDQLTAAAPLIDTVRNLIQRRVQIEQQFMTNFLGNIIVNSRNTLCVSSFKSCNDKQYIDTRNELIRLKLGCRAQLDGIILKIRTSSSGKDIKEEYENAMKNITRTIDYALQIFDRVLTQGGGTRIRRKKTLRKKVKRPRTRRR